MYKIGYACKYLHHDQSLKSKILEEKQRPYNTKSTTLSWLRKQTQDDAEERILSIINHNLSSIDRQIEYVGGLRDEFKMLRLGSDILPFYTHNEWKHYYKESDISRVIASKLNSIGHKARSYGIKLSFHPGQFVALGSDKDDVVDRSIEEFEYHVEMLKMMGYCRSFQDAKCNVHVSGRKGPEGVKESLKRMSTEARNVITIENDEMSWGLDSILELSKDVALVLDIHHHFIMTGEYIDPSDERVKEIKDSWRGVRPTIHYSLSRESLLENHPSNEKPDMQDLLESGHKKQKLRAHSEYMWNDACNEWSSKFLKDFDIMIEAKAKNLARDDYYSRIKKYL